MSKTQTEAQASPASVVLPQDLRLQFEQIPDQLPKSSAISEAERMTAETVHEIMQLCDQAILRVQGNCMEGAGIEDGGFVAVDFNHMPRPPRYGEGGYEDACMCLATWPGQTPAVMVKAYSGKWGSVHCVGTRYKDPLADNGSLNAGLFAEEIYGVICASWDRAGQLKWARDTGGYPETLPDAPTIHGDNVGDPILCEGVCSR